MAGLETAHWKATALVTQGLGAQTKRNRWTQQPEAAQGINGAIMNGMTSSCHSTPAA